MSKKIKIFPSLNNKFNFIEEEERVYRELREDNFKNVKFTNKKDEVAFDESLKILANFIITGNGEFMQKAYEKSPYNIAAKIYILLNQEKTPIEKIEDVKQLQYETITYPIKGNPYFRNDFNKVVLQHLLKFYMENKMESEVSDISYIWINLGQEKFEYDSVIYDLIKVYLKIDAADSFYNLYDKLSPSSQKNEVVQLAKIVFDVRRMDEKEVLETLATLKHINPNIEKFLDFAEDEALYDSDKFVELMFVKTKVEALMEFVLNSYVMGYLMKVNSKVRIGEQLNKKIKARSISLESMKENPIFKNLSPQVLTALKKVGLVAKEDFLSVTESYLFNEVANVGKKSIEQLKENGVKFKKEGR